MNLKVLVEKIGVPDESVQSTVVSQRASTDLSADQAVVNLRKWVLVQRIHRVVMVAMESGNCFRCFEDPSVWKMCCKDF